MCTGIIHRDPRRVGIAREEQRKHGRRPELPIVIRPHHFRHITIIILLAAGIPKLMQHCPPGIMQGIIICSKSHGIQRPLRSAIPAGEAGPYILMRINEDIQPVLSCEGYEILEIRNVVFVDDARTLVHDCLPRCA